MPKRREVKGARLALVPGEELTLSFERVDGTRIEDTFTVIRLISEEGGSGLVYEVTGRHSGAPKGSAPRRLIIKECYPLCLSEVISIDQDGFLVIEEKSAEDDLPLPPTLASQIFESYKDQYERAFIWQTKISEKLPNHTTHPQGLAKAHGTLYILSDIAEAKTMSDLYAEGPLTPTSFSQTLDALICTAEILNSYHKEGYVYLDVKPDNILIPFKVDNTTPYGQATFFDFDTVHETEGEDRQVNSWEPASSSKGYSPIEQRPENPRYKDYVGWISDLYSTGATLHWLVTGTSPHPERDLERLDLEYEWEAREGLELAYTERALITQILSHTLIKNPAQRKEGRYKDMEDLVEDMRSLKEAAKIKIVTYLPKEEEVFLGRTEERMAITSSLYKASPFRIYGTPGLGKTSLAKAYAEDALAEGLYDTAAFITWQGSALLTALSLRIKGLSLIDDPQIRNSMVLNTLAEADRKTLICLDNYEEDTREEKSQEEKLFSDALLKGNFHLLITQRADLRAGSYGLEIGPLREDDLVELYFLYRGTSPKRAEEEVFLRSTFLNTISRHTLLLVLSAKLIADKSLYSLEELNDELTKDLLSAPGNDITHEKDSDAITTTYSKHIARLIDLNELSEMEHRLLALFSLLPPTGTYQDLVCMLCLAEDFDSTLFDNTLASLIRRGLVRRSAEKRLSLHRLVSDVAAPYLTDFLPALESFLTKTGDYFFSLNETSDNQELEEAIDLGKGVLRRDIDEVKRALIYNEIGLLNRDLAHYSEALEFHMTALTIREKVFGEEHLATALSYNNVGGALSNLGNYKEALSYYKRSLSIREKTLGEEHPTTALSYNNIGSALSNLGNHKEAFSYYIRSLTIREKTLGKEHPDTARSYNSVGFALRNLGDYEEAFTYLKRSLAICKKTLGEEHPTTARSYNNVGFALSDLGEYEEAFTCLKRSLAIREKTLGEEHPDTALSYNNIGSALSDLGDNEEALAYYKRSLAICKMRLGEEHPDTALSYNNIGSALSDLGDNEEALVYYKRSLAICKMRLGEEHPDTARSYNNIATVYEKLGDTEKAQYYRDRARGSQSEDENEEYE